MKILRRLIEQLELANRRHHLFKKKEHLLVAVSGGSDSMALVALLMALRKKYSWRLSVVHLNHGFQRNGSRAQQTVQKFCAANGLPFYSKSIHLRSSAKKQRRSLEDAGRTERYLYFSRLAKKIRAGKIVTAHTLDDQVETVLMRLFRGAAFRGLAGIPYTRACGEGQLIRPLLLCSKKDLTAFAKARRLPIVEDPSNQEERFLRNSVRHHLLPLLRRRYNPRIDEQLANLQAVCRDTQETIDAIVGDAYQKCLTRSPRAEIRLSLTALQKFSPAIRSEIFLLGLSKLKGDRVGFTHSHVRSMIDIALSSRPQAETHLPHGFRVYKKRGVLSVVRHE